MWFMEFFEKVFFPMMIGMFALMFAMMVYVGIDEYDYSSRCEAVGGVPKFFAGGGKICLDPKSIIEVP